MHLEQAVVTSGAKIGDHLLVEILIKEAAVDVKATVVGEMKKEDVMSVIPETTVLEEVALWRSSRPRKCRKWRIRTRGIYRGGNQGGGYIKKIMVIQVNRVFVSRMDPDLNEDNIADHIGSTRIIKMNKGTLFMEESMQQV